MRVLIEINYIINGINYNVVIQIRVNKTTTLLRGCSVSDSLVTVIGDQMALRRPVFSPSVLILQAVTVVLWEVNSVCSIHSRVQPCPADEYVGYSCWPTSAIWPGSHSRPCVKLEGYINGLLHMLGTMYRWYVADFSSGLWNIPTPIDQVLDGRVVQTNVKIDALCEHRWPPEQHPGKKSEHMSHLLCHQGPLGTVYLLQDSDQTITYTTTPPSTATLVSWKNRLEKEWRSVVFSDESRFCSSSSDGRTRVRRRFGERHLPECIRSRHTCPTSGFMAWGVERKKLF